MRTYIFEFDQNKAMSVVANSLKEAIVLVSDRIPNWAEQIKSILYVKRNRSDLTGSICD